MLFFQWCPESPLLKEAIKEAVKRLSLIFRECKQLSLLAKRAKQNELFDSTPVVSLE